jgi:hypothetical protein
MLSSEWLERYWKLVSSPPLFTYPARDTFGVSYFSQHAIRLIGPQPLPLDIHLVRFLKCN